MATHLLLSVDLPNHVTTDQRDKFNAKLAELHCTKLHHLDTVWRASYKEDATISTAGAISETQRDVAAAAHAGIREYYGAVRVGPDQPTEFRS